MVLPPRRPPSRRKESCLIIPPVPIRETACYRKGWIQVQDEASQLIGHLVDPQPGENILDLCAGAGMKATHLAELMDNRGSILALDMNENKITALAGIDRKTGRYYHKRQYRQRRFGYGTGVSGKIRQGARGCALLRSRHAEKKPGNQVATAARKM